MRPELRDRVARRARFSCEYCRLPQEAVIQGHEVDHIKSIKLGGETALENLAWACIECNKFKGPIISGPADKGELVPLFNPRTQRWTDHFRLDGPTIVPLSPIGEATIRTLNLNIDRRVTQRLFLQRSGHYPTEG